jgi:hypothetical protein
VSLVNRGLCNLVRLNLRDKVGSIEIITKCCILLLYIYIKEGILSCLQTGFTGEEKSCTFLNRSPDCEFPQINSNKELRQIKVLSCVLVTTDGVWIG